MPSLTPQDFATAFGTTLEELRATCGEVLERLAFPYEPVAGEARDELILRILKRIETDKQTVGAPERQEVWNSGWQEALDDFVASGDDLEALVPRFIRAGQPVRLNQQYVTPGTATFELDWLQVLRTWLYRTSFAPAESVYEFGCGTGFNLVALAKLYPRKKLFGLDFVPSSVDLVNRIGQVHHLNLEGHLFDMIHPDPGFSLARGAAVFTIGSLEQLAGAIQPFFDYLLGQPLSLCVHVEPVLDFYDDANLVDWLALRFQGKRGYTSNLFTHLKALESAGRIELLKVKRLHFGSLFMEGYNLIIWRPRE